MVRVPSSFREIEEDEDSDVFDFDSDGVAVFLFTVPPEMEGNAT